MFYFSSFSDLKITTQAYKALIIQNTFNKQNCILAARGQIMHIEQLLFPQTQYQGGQPRLNTLIYHSVVQGGKILTVLSSNNSSN